MDQVKSVLQLDVLIQNLKLDVKVLETSVLSGKNCNEGFQWLTDKVAWS